MMSLLKDLSSEDKRYSTSKALAWVGWIGTAAVVVARALEIIPAQMGLISVLSVGLAVAASLSLSRMRLARTITGVFEAGLASAVTLSTNVFTDTCIMSLDLDGKVTAVDHADAIGWETEALTGRELSAITQGGIGTLLAGLSVTCPMLSQDGMTFEARISVASLSSSGRELIATVSPVVTR